MVNERPAKIHVILITANGDQTEVFTVKSENVKDVDDLCDQVKAICSCALAHVDRTSLRVFSNEENYSSGLPLQSFDSIDALGSDPKIPIIVVVLSKSLSKRSRIRAPSGASYPGGVSIIWSLIPFVSNVLTIPTRSLASAIQSFSFRGMIYGF